MHSNIAEADGGVTIDLTEADRLNPFGEMAPLYLSIKKGAGEPEIIGGEAKIYEEKNDFITYEIKRDGSHIITVK
jgi:hypothetical protein